MIQHAINSYYMMWYDIRERRWPGEPAGPRRRRRWPKWGYRPWKGSTPNDWNWVKMCTDPSRNRPQTTETESKWVPTLKGIAAGAFGAPGSDSEEEEEESGKSGERHAEGPDHPEGKTNIYRWFWDFSARAGLNVFPSEMSLRSELRSPSYLWEALGTPAPT